MNVAYSVLICVALAAIEFLIGGTRLLFALPAYGILALAGLISLGDLRRPKLPANGWCLASSALFFGYVLVRTLTSPVAYIAWSDRFMVLAALIVYLLTACYLTDTRRRLWVFAGLMALAMVNLFFGARQFASGTGTMLFGFIRSAQYHGRASGLYICPDHLAGYLEVVSCLGLAIALWSRCRPWVKVLVGYLSLCCLVGILITGSRGGYLSIAAGLSVLIVLGLLRVRATSPGLLPRALLAVVILVALAGAGVTLSLRGSTLLQGRARTLLDRKDVRMLLWPTALQQFEVSPVFGTGSATFLFYGRKFRNPTVQDDPIRTHNDYLELLAEYGAVGAVGLLLFLGAHLRWGWKAFEHLSLRYDSQGGSGSSGSNAAAWNIGSLAAVTCIAAHSIVDFNLHIPANALLMAFVFGQLANPGRTLAGGEQAARLRGIDLLPRLALPVLALWILAEGLPKLPGEYFAEKARVALRDGRSVAAIEFARRGLEYETDNPLLYDYMGGARLKLAGDGADTPLAHSFRLGALDAYAHAVDLAPQDSAMLMRLGETFTRLGDLPAAGQIFDRALFWDPNSAIFQTYYGFYLQRSGRLDQAEAAYRRANALAANPAAYHGLEQIAEARAAALPSSN